MKFLKNRLLTLLLSIVLLCPMIAGECLHLFLGCSEKNCHHSHTVQQVQEHANCSHDHSSHHSNDESCPVTTEKDSCFICKFLAIPRVAPVAVVWNPEIHLLENQSVVFLSLDVASYQNFEFGRAPPFFV